MLKWCQEFPLSGYFVGAMWDKNFNTLYVAIHVNDISKSMYISLY